jgi:hypothetical protein
MRIDLDGPSRARECQAIKTDLGNGQWGKVTIQESLGARTFSYMVCLHDTARDWSVYWQNLMVYKVDRRYEMPF